MDNGNLTISNLETMREGNTLLLAGRYKVVRRLGEGGMGSVWLAEDTKLDGRAVAVKMLPAVLAGKKGAYRQVKQEALMAMKLSHPNIATVRSFEEDEGGSPFLVMDYIEGTGLDDILAEKGALGEAETLKLLGPVAAALDYAHAKGVVHRDVKPGNVIVDRNGTPFVLDFGIAREIQETMTRVTGKFSSGTLLYMSPEQLRGRAPKPAQDVYSFAAMAYECLAGTPPFSRGQIEYQIVNEAPEPLPEAAPGEALRQGIMSGLAKEPEQRPGTCMGVLGNGGASRPGEPEKGDAAGTTAGRTTRPEGSPHHGPAGRRNEGGDVFLRKVRVGRALEEVQREDATAEEKAELERIREVYTAGIEALNAGRDGAAGELFVQAEEALAALREEMEATRRQREREEAERHRKDAEERERKRREEEARQDRERRQRFLEESKQPAGTTKVLILPGGAKLEMVWCPAGEFTMGSPQSEPGRKNDETEHRVALSSGFWIGKYPVTQEQWTSVMGKAITPPSSWEANLPVAGVSWTDCQAFCRKAGRGLRLPTETQWEYACRAGSSGAYGGTGELNEMGWYEGNGGENLHLHPVGRKKANAWGVHDMHGNVWEWCEDLYTAYPTGAATDPHGKRGFGGRVLRGGSYWNSAQVCRSANRNCGTPSKRHKHNGFRVVISPGRGP